MNGTDQQLRLPLCSWKKVTTKYYAKLALTFGKYQRFYAYAKCAAEQPPVSWRIIHAWIGKGDRELRIEGDEIST